MQRQFSTTFIAFFALLFFGFIWGMSVPLTKVAVSTGHQPLGMIFWQLVFMILALGAIILWRRDRLYFERRFFYYYFMISMLGALLPDSFAFLTYQHLPAGVMGLIVTTVPMLTLLIALTMKLEKPDFIRLFGIGLGVTAMMLIALPEASLPDPSKAPWLLVAMIAPICYSIEGIYIALRAPDDVNPIVVLFNACVIGLFIATPLAIFSGQWIDITQPWGKAEWALLGSSLAHAFSYAGYIWLVGFAGAVFSSQMAYPITLAAIIISILLLGEVYSLWIWGAVGMMLVGLMLVQPLGKMPEEINEDVKL